MYPFTNNTRTLRRSRTAILVEHLALNDKKPFKVLRMPDEKLLGEYADRENAVRGWNLWYADGSHVR